MTTREHSLASPGNAWPAGHRIGAFELQAVVSSRSSAIVYRAWDATLGRPVAIKEYLPARLARRGPQGDVQPSGDEEAVAFRRGLDAFVDEARLLAQADHPSLVRVLHLLPLHGTAYRVMPWYAGHTLAEVRRDMDAPPDEAALRRLVDDLLGALEAWHRVGGVHGALAPSQVLLLEDDRALLLGPGRARRATASDAVEALMRQLEPSYAAPDPVPGVAGDLYALAETARFAVTGLAPPPAGGVHAEPLAPAAQRAGGRYAPALLQALEAAAAPDPAARPAGIAALRERLAGGRAAPPPAPSQAPDSPPADDGMASDEETASLIHAVIASIPDAPPRPPGPPAPPSPALDADLALPPLAAPERDPPPAAPRRPRAPWAVAAALVAGIAAWGAWRYVDDQAQVDRLVPPLALQTLPPLAAAPAPLAPTDPAPPIALPPAAPPLARAPAVPAGERSPRAQCGLRSDFALYRCMQQQCALAAWSRHPQCIRFKRTDHVD